MTSYVFIDILQDTDKLLYDRVYGWFKDINKSFLNLYLNIHYKFKYVYQHKNEGKPQPQNTLQI